VPARACTGGRRRACARARHRRAVDRPSIAPLCLRSDLPSRDGPPTFRSDQPDRAEPSQHAPPLPVTPAIRLGPSARRRAPPPPNLHPLALAGGGRGGRGAARGRRPTWPRARRG